MKRRLIYRTSRLTYRTRSYGAQDWKDIRQRVPITWTNCAHGGRRPWFTCAVSANGRYCGRRVAISLYAAGDLFARPCCYGLAYASQSESPRDRSLSQAQKIRMRLGEPECVRSHSRQTTPDALAHVKSAAKSRNGQ